MAPRGLKKILKTSVSAKLVGKGKFKCFQPLRAGTPNGRKLRGLTKALESTIWSSGTLPTVAKYGKVARAGWRGKGGGRRRGIAVDSQLSRAVNAGKSRPQKGQYTLVKIALAMLADNGLEPVACQRAVCSERARLGTAIDILAYEKLTSRLVVVELKCGCSGAKTAAATKNGRPCTMSAPLGATPDTMLNRHLTQLACTRALFVREQAAMAKMQAIGIESYVGGALLYVNDEESELYTLSPWWISRSSRLLDALG